MFAEHNRRALRYCHSHTNWFLFDGQRWRQDDTGRTAHQIRLLCEDAAAHRNNSHLARVRVVRAVEALAKNDPALAVRGDIWDRDPMLLGTPDGVVDLRSGRLRPGGHADFITKSTAITPADTADCTLWRRFVNDVTGGDANLAEFIQRHYGYGLTGSVKEQALIFIYGPGGAGKSTLHEVLQNILGEYACQAPMQSFLSTKYDRHPTELAMLNGRRLVLATETQRGRSWNEALLKQLTGGDTISARFMRQDFFSFAPTFKLSFIGNYQPRLRDLSEATRRRFNIVPFRMTPEATRDRDLAEKLRSEYPAILRWLIDGCLAWQRQGLNPPPVVRRATETYFAEQDIVARWLDECCDTTDRTAVSRVSLLYKSVCDYVERHKETTLTAHDFGAEMARLGFTKMKSLPTLRDVWGYRGIRLTT